MKTNKLKKLKLLLRKASLFLLVIGLLVNSYAIYIALPSSEVQAEFTQPDCGGAADQSNSIVSAGVVKENKADTLYRVRNCATTDQTVNAKIYSYYCSTSNSVCDPGQPRIQKAVLKPGEYHTFEARYSDQIKCGTIQTQIELDNNLTSSGFAYTSPSGSCEQTTLLQQNAVEATPPSTPYVEPVPGLSGQTVIMGRVKSFPNETEFWQSQNACGSQYPVAPGLNVNGHPLNVCNNTGPLYNSGSITPSYRSVTVNNLPPGYKCEAWLYQNYNKQTDTWETVANGKGCTMSATFRELSDPYDNSHHVAFYIYRESSPSPTSIITPTFFPTPSITPTATSVITPAPTYSAEPSFTPQPTPPIGGPSQTPTASGYPSPSSATPTPTSTPVQSASITPIPTNSPSSNPTPSLQPSPSFTASPTPPSTAQLKICKYQDDNADGFVNGRDAVISWDFTYTNQQGGSNLVSSHWWYFWQQGCAIVDVPTGQNITVNENLKSGWRITGLYADGAKVDTTHYTYTPDPDAVKVLWFLNTFTPDQSPNPSPSGQYSPTPVPSFSPTPSAMPSISPTNAPVTSTPVPTSTFTPQPSPSTNPSPSSSLRSIRFNLDQQNNSGQSGVATVNELSNSQTEVVLSLQGGNYNNQPAHVHTGTCLNSGPIVYPLNNVVNGQSTTVVNANFDTLLNLSNSFNAVINVHRSEQDMTVTACGPAGGVLPSTAPTALPTFFSSATPSPTPSTTPVNNNTELKICKYEDTNSDGFINGNEKTIAWNFNVTYDNTITTYHRNLWDNIWHQGCLIIDVPAQRQIKVGEEASAGWTQTAIYADGAKLDNSSDYTYNSQNDSIKVLWFLNHRDSEPSPSPSASVSPIPTVSPTISPSPTNYNITLEKRVDGTRVDNSDTVGIQYKVRVRNNGTQDITNLELIDTLPPDFNYDLNTTEGDQTANPSIEDISGDDNRRLIWRNITLRAGQEINYGYRTTGRRTDTNFCNSAEARVNGAITASSQACVQVNQAAGQVLVAAVGGSKVLPVTGAIAPFISGMVLIALSAIGWKLSRHLE